MVKSVRLLRHSEAVENAINSTFAKNENCDDFGVTIQTIQLPVTDTTKPNKIKQTLLKSRTVVIRTQTMRLQLKNENIKKPRKYSKLRWNS